ncbi:GMC family oxidoreductase [Pseudomonadota bacterium]|nr:GMC family oxidoreductase [Pseudomonadota bacterium]
MNILNKDFNTHSDFSEKIAILGSGFAAYSFIKNYKNIDDLIVFEGGSFKSNTEKFHFISLNSLKLKSNTVDFSIGGTSNLWTGNLVEPEDYEKDINAFPNKDLWFFGNRQTEYFQKAWKIFHVNPKKYHRNKTQIKNNFIERKIHTQFRPTRLRKEFRKLPLLLCDQMEVIALGEHNEKAFVEFKCLRTKQNKKVSFKAIILCAGGLGCINILQKSLKSDYLDSKKLPKYLGRFYMNHPKFTIDNFLDYSPNKKSIFLKNKYFFSDSLITYSLDPSTQSKLGCNNTSFTFIPNFLKDESEEFKFLYMIFTNKLYFLKNISHILRFIFFRKKPTRNNLNNYFAPTKFLNIFKLLSHLGFFLGISRKNPKSYNLQFFMEMEPNHFNTINFQDSKCEANISMGETESKTFKELMRLLNSQLRKENYNFKDISDNLHDYTLLDASHHMGGISYNVDKAYSLVDENMRLDSTKNIFICSSAVFPSSGSFNPTLTIAAISAKVASFLEKY